MRLDYSKDGKDFSRLWEKQEEAILETTFDSDGLVLLQKFIESNDNALDHSIKQTLSEAKVSNFAERVYTEIKINRSCPSCDKQTLSRYVDAFSSNKDIPVVPIYCCTNCKTKSYNLTDSYLEFLIENKHDLFNESELSELQKDRAAVLEEMKGYIIRMFASKKIMSIK